jgi:hypothetical protein
LAKLLLDDYIKNLSKDLLANRKVFHTKRKPNRATLWKVMGVGNPNNYTISVDPDENTFHVRNLEKNLCYVVSCQESTCTCKAFAKLGYCKHLLYVLKRSNKSSVTVDLTGVRTFVNRGNTIRARAQARNNVAWANTPRVGRVPNANSAWNRM